MWLKLTLIFCVFIFYKYKQACLCGESGRISDTGLRIEWLRCYNSVVHLFERQLGQPGVFQHLLSLGGRSVTDLQEQIVGVEAAMLTNSFLRLQDLGPHVRLARAQQELLLTAMDERIYESRRRFTNLNSWIFVLFELNSSTSVSFFTCCYKSECPRAPQWWGRPAGMTDTEERHNCLWPGGIRPLLAAAGPSPHWAARHSNWKERKTECESKMK